MKKLLSLLPAHPYISFTIINLSPIILVFLSIELLVIFGHLLAGKFPAGMIVTSISTFMIFLMPLVLGLTICYILFKKTNASAIRGLILYTFWFTLIYAGTCFFVSVLTFGALMEFGHDPTSMDQPTTFPKEFFIWSSIISIFWSSISVYLINRFIPNLCTKKNRT